MNADELSKNLMLLLIATYGPLFTADYKFIELEHLQETFYKYLSEITSVESDKK